MIAEIIEALGLLFAPRRRPRAIPPDRCPRCKGSGEESHPGRDGATAYFACRLCHGSGKRAKDPTTGA